MRLLSALSAGLALVSFLNGCILNGCAPAAGAPCCSSDAACVEGALCFEGRCALACDDDAQCDEGERCLARGVCRGVQLDDGCEYEP